MISLFRKILNYFLVVLILGGSVVTDGYHDNEIEIIAENITQGLLNGSLCFSSSDIKDADKIIPLIAYDDKENAYFSDVNYEDTTRSSWEAARHITRTERLAILYRLETDESKKEEYKNYVLSLLDYWIDNDYQNSNWWYNRLSNPNILGEIGILMRDDLSSKQLVGLSELVSRGSYTVSPVLEDHTGANAMDLAMATIKFGVLTGSRSAIKRAVKVVSEDLKYSDGEGLKNDSTFFQHGNRIYMGGYGAVYITGFTSIMSMLSGTKYIFTKEQMEPFAGFILDGLRPMSFGSTLDPTTMGRSVSRKNPQPLMSIVPTLRKLAQIEEMPRKDELLSYAESIENDTKNDFGLKYFETAKFLVINNSDFYFSFRGGDDSFAYSEIINDENVLSYNSSFPGITTIMHTGKEYNNVSPIYDYSLVPGATAVYETDSELFAHEDYTYRYLKGTYGSKTADGAVAVFVKTSHEGIDMTVSCFATDNAVILLGAGMKDAQGRAMNTAIDQSYYTGSFTRDGNTVIHNGIKYTLLEGGKLNAFNEHRTGNWKRNNLTLSDAPVEGDLFKIYIENTGSYAYTVMSENTEADFEVIKNTEEVQAVKLPDGRIAASFFADGSFSFEGKTYSGKKGTAEIF